MDFLQNYIVRSSIYVNPTDKWLWLRIHRTGGTSVLKNITNTTVTSELPETIINDASNKERFFQWMAETSDLSDYFIWSFVRNPYDRFLSMSNLFGHRPDDFVSVFDKLQEASPVVWRHTQPQYLFLHSNMSFVGRFENIQPDFRVLGRKLGFIDQQLPHLNSSKKYTKLTPKVIDFVNERFELDFTLLNYKMK